MKKRMFIGVLLLCTAVFAFAQGSLQFNAAKLISSTDGVQTVPAGKVWKVMSVFGGTSEIVACYALPAYCVNSSWPTSSVNSIRGKGYKVNGIVVWQSIDLTESAVYYTASNCTGATTALSGQANCLADVNKNFPSQNFEELDSSLPFWIPAGATLEGLGATTYISVLEFNIIP